MTLQEMLHAMSIKTTFTDAEVDALDHAFAAAGDQEVHDAVMSLGPSFAAQTLEQKEAFHLLNQRLAQKPGFRDAIPRLHAWKQALKAPATEAEKLEDARAIEIAASFPPGICGLGATWTDLTVDVPRLIAFLRALPNDQIKIYFAANEAAFDDANPGADNNAGEDRVAAFWRAMIADPTWPELVALHPELAYISENYEDKVP